MACLCSWAFGFRGPGAALETWPQFCQRAQQEFEQAAPVVRRCILVSGGGAGGGPGVMGGCCARVMAGGVGVPKWKLGKEGLPLPEPAPFHPALGAAWAGFNTPPTAEHSPKNGTSAPPNPPSAHFLQKKPCRVPNLHALRCAPPPQASRRGQLAGASRVPPDQLFEMAKWLPAAYSCRLVGAVDEAFPGGRQGLFRPF